MSIQITGKNVEAGDAYQSYVSEKIRAVVLKYLGRDTDSHIRLEKERGLFKTSCSIRLPSGLMLEANGEAGDAYASADEAVERLETRVKRHRSRLKSHSSSSTRHKNGIDAPDYDVRVEQEDKSEHIGSNPLIIAESQRNILELAVSEAVMQLDLSEAPFMIFRNAAHGGVNVVYRRPDGHIGWIDAGAAQPPKFNGAS